MDFKSLGKKIKEERRKLNLTQEQLADKVSVT
jgi:transcriptional regulator with XRE-family HTH domain